MGIFIYPAEFRIRKKADAKAFLTICEKGTFHWTDGEMDYWMEYGSVCSRPVWARGDIFTPTFDFGKESEELIWKNRKLINAELAR